MTCLRKKDMTDDEAPYVIEFQKELPWREAQKQMLWLAAVDSPTEGFFTNGRKQTRVLTENGYDFTETVWYRFTDQNTAFWFKMQFG
ncbi:MAG: hypothetical protein EOP83_12170 [Verrucomicrobiaceae bacterium]|nr:MAG: hypothetical protein EOP83_12170 [Verrucomicrobiaceae bacterium]